MTIKAIIVEDETQGMHNLSLKLGRHCPEVEIIGKAETGEKAVKMISQLQPQVVFLDIQLGTMSGFDVLSKLSHIHFEVIFTTAYDNYGIKAIKANALDYLIKPIKPKELITAVEKAMRVIQKAGPINRIAVPISNGFQIIPVKDILYCEADNTYTKIFLNQSSKLLVTKPLADTERKLPADKFCRIHRKYVVNLDYVNFFKKEDGGIVVLEGGAELLVAKARRDDFLKQLSENM